MASKVPQEMFHVSWDFPHSSSGVQEVITLSFSILFNDQTFCKDIITTDVNLATKGPLGIARHWKNSEFSKLPIDNFCVETDKIQIMLFSRMYLEIIFTTW